MKKLDIGTRLGSMIMDHMSMSFIVMIFCAPGMIYDFVQMFNNPDYPNKIFLGNYYVNIFAFSLYFNKDIYLGRSIAKRVLGLQVVDVKTGKPANPLQCFARNLTIILWPIEFVVSLINQERRIGDYLAGTKLEVYNPETHQGEPNWAFVFLALIISIVVTYSVLFYPFERLLQGTGLYS